MTSRNGSEDWYMITCRMKSWPKAPMMSHWRASDSAIQETIPRSTSQDTGTKQFITVDRTTELGWQASQVCRPHTL